MIDTALRLPAPDIEALLQGRIIAAMPQIFIDRGRQFALYPCDASNNVLSSEQYYRSDFLPIAQTALSQLGSETVAIKAWARCELTEILDNAESVTALSRLLVWTGKALQEILLKRYIFLTYLRVYQLPEPVFVPPSAKGQFVPLPKPLTVNDASPVLNSRIFTQRRHQLKHRLSPQHPELEELQGAIAQLGLINPVTMELYQDIQILLSGVAPVVKPGSDLEWIKTIASVGNSSDGQSFEKLVRKSLIKLGFTNSNSKPEASLDPDATGGAGGLDFYCEAPYSVVGECKASKDENVPNKVSAQLIHLGYTHLSKAQFDLSIKLIVVAGFLTKAAEKAAVEHKMNVMRPETIQRLAELNAHSKGSIDLLELKHCWQSTPFGENADAKVNNYIDKVWQDIKLRSHIVQTVDELKDASGEYSTAIEIRTHYNAKFAESLNSKLSVESIHDILIELSSPLTGYLGRNKGVDWRNDRFYFLRDLPLAN